jgi:hypothetical protein
MAKRKTPTTSKVTRTTTTAPMRAQRTAAVASEDIARLAYEKFVARGCEHGHDVTDWLAAEVELSAR